MPVRRLMGDRTWESDKDWARTSELFRQYMGEGRDGRKAAVESRKPEVCFAAVESWLRANFRDCAYRGTIEGLNPDRLNVSAEDGGTLWWPSKEFLVMDPWLTGTVIAAVLVLAGPVDKKKLWLSPGDMTNTKAMDSATQYLETLIASQQHALSSKGMRFEDVYGHAEMIIVAGADMLRARWNPSVSQPAITQRHEIIPAELAEGVARLGEAFADVPQKGAVYVPMMLHSVLSELKGLAPKTTIWDEGELLFPIQGQPYPHATRILVIRDEASRDSEVEATEYQLTLPESHFMAQNEPLFLWRNSQPGKDPGGIIAITLVISTAADAPWPKVGEFEKGPVMRAAAAALLDLVEEWNRRGKLQRCLVRVDMGFDAVRYSWVGSKLDPDATELPKRDAPGDWKKPEGMMEGFFVKVEEIRKHQLFDSEEHFQGIKAMMTQRMLQDPERFKAMALDIAKASSTRALEMNFPGSEITFEEDLPIRFNGRDVETAVVVARKPNTTKKDIVSAVYCIPSPDGELHVDASGKRKEWLGTPEAKAGLAKLLERMQQWQREDRIAEGECMAELMIGIDADVYLFVDGRFEEPTDERMARYIWG
ncbi:hypothetical protein NLU13_0516 [Sarocladium strictum]|uniref:Uncharacterized protein n=1 Tax=Sarocladium strictum TaxID=5046 RepID=A0AA39GR32_SARSR|nr:hypothetical protein NLU13_0516 [Sarocladium strictum]